MSPCLETAVTAPLQVVDEKLAAYVDLMMEVTEPNACELEIKLKPFLVEFRPGYDFSDARRRGGGLLPGANEELPELDYDVPGVGKGTTRNIVKLIEEDDKKIDDPFGKKLP